MAILLELHGQGAAALGADGQPHPARHVEAARLPEPAPVDGGIAAGTRRARELAVLQEQERVHDQRRDVLEVREEHVPRPSVVERLTPEIMDDESRHRRLAVGRRHAPSHEADCPRALARLFRHRVSGGGEPSAEIAESWIASLGVEGTAAREGDARARPGFDLVRESRRVAREQPGLYGGGAELVVDEAGRLLDGAGLGALDGRDPHERIAMPSDLPDLHAALRLLREHL